MRKKRIFAVFLCTLLLLTVLPFQAFAQEIADEPLTDSSNEFMPEEGEALPDELFWESPREQNVGTSGEPTQRTFTCEGFINDPARLEYVDFMMSWYINNRPELLSTLKSGAPVVMFFEGGSDNAGIEPYKSNPAYRSSAVCLVIRYDSKTGSPYIAYYNTCCTTLPDYPFNYDYSNGRTNYGMATVLDGIYSLYTVNHKSSYAAFNVRTGSSEYVRALYPKRGGSYSVLNASGINIHTRTTDRISSNENNPFSAGCLLVGDYLPPSEYDAFVRAAAPSACKFGTYSFYGYPLSKYTSGIYIKAGMTVIDRYLAKDAMLSIYKDREMVECITEFSSDIHTYSANRLAGEHRLATAIAISERGWSASKNAVIAGGINYPDALTAAPLASILDCPILLTINTEDGLEKEVAKELERLKAENIYIIGGENVVSQKIEKELGASGRNIIRLAGTDRYGTAVEVSKKLLELRRSRGLGNFSNIYFCSAESFADSLSISPVAGIECNPVLYAPSAGKSLSQASAEMYDYIKSLGSSGMKTTTIVGGVYAVSPEAADDIESITGKAPARIDAGMNGTRFDTMLAVCKKYDSLFSQDGSVCVATGLDFPDALAGAPFAAKTKSPIILVGYYDSKTTINNNLKAYIESRDVEKCYSFGGSYAVPEEQLRTLLS